MKKKKLKAKLARTKKKLIKAESLIAELQATSTAPALDTVMPFPMPPVGSVIDEPEVEHKPLAEIEQQPKSRSKSANK